MNTIMQAMQAALDREEPMTRSIMAARSKAEAGYATYPVLRLCLA